MAQYGSPYGGNDSGHQGYGGGDGYAQGYGQHSPYGGAGYADPGDDVEMSNYGGVGGSVLDECRAIDQEIDVIDRNLDQLRLLQQQSLGDVSGGAGSAGRQLDGLTADTMDLYRALTLRVRNLKSRPEAGQQRNAAQVTRIDRRLKEAIARYRDDESAFRNAIQDQVARQYRIVRPDATEDEVRAAVDTSSGGEVFSQALLRSGRQGQASAALGEVKNRHAQILKIERQMVELAQLFQDVDAVVVQQDAAVQRIEESGMVAENNLAEGNKHVDSAVEKARAARKKKWICLGIVVLIIIVIIVVVLAVLGGKYWPSLSADGNQAKPFLSPR
ncbi:related to putative snare protein syn [Cephalotrichum gorgonifer]|uniref:Related to putative snare protein syn n=1 Tax=Cephalotrichum gorgonifer TaxID=2041049 RepID=A0AAE8N537_9PEZI|nr:related to putative snare protein syn [Cephalotrichum gorgonifer]